MTSRRQPKKLGTLLLIFSIFSSAGGHLLALQSMAWASMLKTNLKYEQPLVAMQKTFDGKHPCGRCHEIAKEQAKKASIPASEIERRFDPFDVSVASFEARGLPNRLPLWAPNSPIRISLHWNPPTPPPKLSRFVSA